MRDGNETTNQWGTLLEDPLPISKSCEIWPALSRMNIILIIKYQLLNIYCGFIYLA